MKKIIESLIAENEKKTGKVKFVKVEQIEEKFEDKSAKKNGKKAKSTAKTERLQYANIDAPAPDLDNEDQSAWVRGLGKRSTGARGYSNSDQYNEFYKTALAISKIAETISRLKEDIKDATKPEEEIVEHKSHLTKKDKKILSQYVNYNGLETNKDILRDMENAYKDTWKTLVEQAKAYEKFKIQDKHFTRDENNKDFHQLKYKSKLKFDLMDEIFRIKDMQIPLAKAELHK